MFFDNQLYVYMKPDNTHLLVKLQEYLRDIKTWMNSNFLFLNSEKTEVFVLGLKKLINMVSNQILSLDGIALASSNTGRTLRIFFD